MLLVSLDLCFCSIGFPTLLFPPSEGKPVLKEGEVSAAAIQQGDYCSGGDKVPPGLKQALFTCLLWILVFMQLWHK